MNRHLVLSLCLALVSLTSVASLVSGCGGAMAERRREPTQDAHAQLDAEEARLHEAEEQLRQLDPAACPDRCRASASICDAAGRICTLAADLGDEASAGRCQRARTSCDEASSATQSCGCEPAQDAGVAK